MLSSVLRSPQAVQVNIAIMRAFVRLRQLLSSNTHLARRLDQVERWIKSHDPHLPQVYRVIQRFEVLTAEEVKKGQIGFTPRRKKRK